ncbi:DUF4367 domain-containing protein [Oceanirhabdus seepicola]|uniref:DUF4367 domain-containing protein n=1 Tax=Oceanirhabdus seepicola TaxID=2828781 RepID=A0A9J6P7A1_9CLOT|nr:DUF4367 domain-containing protein [Oceanirhabdus seepicola]MCM1991841.1 DUF4367 domain-containing protein [Oceanirhabdus seepicola]
MSKRTIEDKFSIEMDGYFKGIENKNKSEFEEYDELLELGKALADKDFSKDSNKEAVFNKVYKNINQYKGDNIMKKTSGIKRIKVAIALFAATCILGVSLMQTSFAQEIVEKIINKITIGNVTSIQIEEPEEEVNAIPDIYKGKIFDKDGNSLDIIPEGYKGGMFTKDGEKIVRLSHGKVITEEMDRLYRQEKLLVVSEVDKLNDYTCFNVGIPTYLPEGFEFDRAEFNKDENGDVKDSKYIDIYFTNKETGKSFICYQTFSSEENGVTTATDGEIEEIEINGVKAVLSSDRCIDMDANGVIYRLDSRRLFAKDELIKIAESIK